MALRAGGVATVVLDECHHLASMWGYVIRAVLSELGDVHVIGLTATPPDALTGDEGRPGPRGWRASYFDLKNSEG